MNLSQICFLGVIFALSTLGSYLLLQAVIVVWKKFKILDRPHLYKSEQGRAPAPYSAGVMLCFTLLLLSPIIYLFGDFSDLLIKRFTIVLVLGVFLSIVSFVDDMDTIGKSPVKIPPVFRLVMQVFIGMIVGITSIKIAYISNIFGGIFYLDDPVLKFIIFGKEIFVFPIIVTVIWYVLIFNSVNFSDGIPGMTGGFALISFVILAILAFKLLLNDISVASQENSRFILMILAIIIPATFWLTRADITRQVIMGDTGTLMLAFLIATLAIIAGGKIATTISVLGVYIIDAIYVIMLRLSRGQNPMK